MLSRTHPSLLMCRPQAPSTLKLSTLRESLAQLWTPPPQDVGNQWPPLRFHWSKFLLLNVLMFGLLFARYPYPITQASPISEDATFLQVAFNHPWWKSLWMPFVGYGRVIARLLSELSLGLFPLRYVGEAFAISSGLVAVFSFSWLYLPAFRNLLRSDALRFALPILFIAGGNADNLLRIYGIHWYLMTWMTLLVLMPWPRSRVTQVLLTVVAVASALTVPTVMLLIPFLALRLWVMREKRERISIAIILAACFAMSLWTVLGGTPTDFKNEPLSLGVFVQSLSNAYAVGWLPTSVLSYFSIREWIHAWGLTSMYVLSGLLIGLLTWGLLKSRDTAKRFSALMLLAIGIGGVLLFAMRWDMFEDYAHPTEVYHCRYFSYPLIMLWLSGAILAERLLGKLMARYWTASLLTVGFAAFIAYQATGFPFPYTPPPLFREFVPAILRIQEKTQETGEPASLVIPTGIRTHDPVLNFNGGRISTKPPKSLEDFFGPDLEKMDKGKCALPGLGHFWVQGEWLYFPNYGWLKPDQFLLGRYYFITSNGASVYTSRLYYPQFFYWYHEPFPAIAHPK